MYVTGRSQGKGTNADYTTIRYDDDGDKEWEKRYNGTGNGEDEAVAVLTDHKGNVYVTGWSVGSGTGRDFATVKYDDDGDKKWVKRFSGPGNDMDEATAIAVDRRGNVYVTGYSTGSGTGRDFTTIKYDDDGDTKWIRRFNGSGNSSDQAVAIAVDAGGNVYVSGYSTGIGTGRDITTIKYDEVGNTKWIKNYNGPINGADRAGALALDDKGNVYVTGQITVLRDEEDDLNYTNIVTIKYNGGGQQQWAVNYNRASEAKGIAVNGDGNVYITGVDQGPDVGYAWGFATIKYNASGIEQWAVTEMSPQNDDAAVNDLALDQAGNVYITGLMWIGHINFVTIKYNTNGVRQWMALYEQGNDAANAIGLDNKGNVYITGNTDPFKGDFATIKYNANGVQKWVQRYDGPGGGGRDVATAIAVDKYGNVHVTGEITSKNTGLDYATFKYDKNGQREWKKTYNGPGVDQAKAVTIDADGNVYVTGTSTGKGTGDDYLTIKYDKDGNTRWKKTYNGPANNIDEATAIAVDKRGNVYVTGSSIGIGTATDYATIKYDCNGVVKWVRRYTGNTSAADQKATAIAVDINGNVYVTGASGGDYATIKYDANGNGVFVALYNGPGNYIDEPAALTLDALGNVYITGRSFGSGTDYDYATIKYNAAWVARFEEPGINFATDIAVDASGNVYVTGGSQGDYATVKYNSAGVQQWVAKYDGLGNSFDLARAIDLDDFGNVYVTGGSGGDYATIKYNPSGVEQWSIRYDGPGHHDDDATGIALDASGNVYVTGGSTGNGTDYDFATIRYEQMPVLTRSSTTPERQNTAVAEAASAKLNVKAFPNAFTEFINLQWNGVDKPVNITITDAIGRLVEKRTGLAASGAIQTGYRFAPGIYYAEIVQGTEKVVLKLIRN